MYNNIDDIKNADDNLRKAISALVKHADATNNGLLTGELKDVYAHLCSARHLINN